MLTKYLLSVLAAFFVSVSAAGAATVLLKGTFEIGSTNGGVGLSVGDLIVFEIVVDNGGSVESNSWSDANVVSATATSGSYAATFNAPYFGNNPIFTTAANGSVTLAEWFDIDNGNTDTLLGAVSVQAFNNALRASDTFLYFYTQSFRTTSAWTASDVSAVPLPAGLPLMLGGLAMLGILRRRSVWRF